MVDFGGWDMPVQYTGIVDEHNTVRTAVGLFDVSHMGEIEIRGPEALKLVDYVSTNAASRLAVGQAHYSGLLYEHGGFVDDILVHKVADDSYFLCVTHRIRRRISSISALTTSSTAKSILPARAMRRSPSRARKRSKCFPGLPPSISQPFGITGSWTGLFPGSTCASRGPATPAKMALKSM